MTKIKWVEPLIVNMEQLPTTLGACTPGASAVNTGGCASGEVAGGTGPGGQLQCKDGGRPAVNQCHAGSTQT